MDLKVSSLKVVRWGKEKEISLEKTELLFPEIDVLDCSVPDSLWFIEHFNFSCSIWGGIFMRLIFVK